MTEKYCIDLDSLHIQPSTAEKIRSKYLALTYQNLENESGGFCRREAEKLLLNYIALGNVSLADEFIAQIKQKKMSISIGSMTRNPLRQACYSLVAFVTLFCRTAIDNGLPENLAYNISDCYIQHLDTTVDIEEINSLFLSAFHEYCQSMQDWRLKNCSLPLRSCCEYVMSHLHSRITLAKLGEICHLSPNYVSDLFGNELGMRPITYIRTEKLKYSCFILANTSMPISEIAELLAFPSPSAYAKQFNDQYHMTPTHYKSIHAGT